MKTNTLSPGGFFDIGSDFPVSRPTDLETLHEELARIGDDDLETWIVDTKQRMDATHNRWLVAVAEYDRRQLSLDRHQLGTTSWLRSTLRLTRSVASSMVRQARGLVQMPGVADKAVAGEITPNGVAQLDAARRRHPDEFDAHAHVLADVATYLNPTDLRKAIGHWRQQIDFPSAVAMTRDQKRRRRLSINEDFDGMWSINGELDPETGALVNKAIEHISRPGYLDGDDRRAPWQVRADALGAICEQSLRHNNTTTSKGTKPHITVTIDADTLLGLRTGLGTINDAPIPPETVDRIVCDSSILRILTNSEGSPIDIGRATRVVPAGMRRVLDARDRGCQWSGCDAPPDWCDAHHIEHWINGGPTQLDNLILLCRTHHTAIHEPNRTCTPTGRPQTARAP